MAHVIIMPDGEYIIPFCFEDALEAVEQYAGKDLRDFIEEYMQDNVDEAGAARLEAEEARKDMEVDADHYREVLLAVEDGLETLSARLDVKRIEKSELKKLVAALRRTINEEL